MSSSAMVHIPLDGSVRWRRGVGPGDLVAEFRTERGYSDTDVYMFTTPDVLGDLLMELTTWDDVVAAVSDRFSGENVTVSVPLGVDDLPAVAVDYFRRGFEMFGQQTAHYACKAVDRG